MVKTKIKVEFFKYTGKYYTGFEYESSFPSYDMNSIRKEVRLHREFITDMSYTIEVDQENAGWNKYLYQTEIKPLQ